MSKIKNLVARIHRDEDGLEAMQVVMIVAIAATVLIAVMAFGNEAGSWLKEKFDELKGTNMTI